MELLRGGLDEAVLDSVGLDRTASGRRVSVAGMVVARQRPATANGVVFMLLEDERGTINLIVPPPVVERCRLAVRTSGFVLARGKLERREETTNVVVEAIERVGAGPGLDRAGDEAEAPGVPTGRPTSPPSLRERERGDPDGARHASRRIRKGARSGWEVISELDRPNREQIVSELAASLPAPHSFGRRGR